MEQVGSPFSGKWRRWSRGHEGALPESGDVEGGMDMHRARKLEPHGRRVDDSLDGEGTDELGSQFL